MGLDSEPSLNGISGGTDDLQADQLQAEISEEPAAKRRARQKKARINTHGQGSGYLGGTGAGHAVQPAPQAPAHAAAAAGAAAAKGAVTQKGGWLNLFHGRGAGPTATAATVRKPKKEDTTVDMGGTDFLDYLPKDKKHHHKHAQATCAVS
eukprot:TRINITY_DN33793_c0_g1_i1.p1 TRINITY_DN33793_c0_g1~~TRINITY_DN33793_c0_g1_i1.p1  ORF type:complete len:151 (+),score=49.33 TRINITY_DN33793_c0_g1_i1:61-513(+)